MIRTHCGRGIVCESEETIEREQFFFFITETLLKSKTDKNYTARGAAHKLNDKPHIRNKVF